jgi:hypothetical protein
MAETITFNEIWSPAYGFEDSYEVSTQGRVRSLERKRKNNHIYKSQFIKTRGEIWCPAMEGKRNPAYGRYARVDLWKDGRRTTKNLARLLWESFNGPIPPGMTIDHINGEKADNRLDNLRCCTLRVNMLNPVTRGRGWETRHNKKMTD